MKRFDYIKIKSFCPTTEIFTLNGNILSIYWGRGAEIDRPGEKYPASFNFNSNSWKTKVLWEYSLKTAINSSITKKQNIGLFN